MLLFPQLSTGATAQYPISRQFSQRNIRAAIEDGTLISRVDGQAKYLRLKILYTGLSDAEANSFVNFFSATMGGLMPFTFLDPTVNLLRWSEDFSQSSWKTIGFSFDAGITDPFGGSGAWQFHNNSGTSLSIAQDTQIPGGAQTCFSVYLKADTPTTASLTRNAGSQAQILQVAVTTTWRRFYMAGQLSSTADLSQFSIDLPAGVSLEIFGPQLDAQVSPSTYVKTQSNIGAVSTTARFDMPGMDIAAMGLDRYMCLVNIRCNLSNGDNS